MKRSVTESNDSKNVSNVLSIPEKRPKIDHNIFQKFSKILLNNGSIQQVVEKDGKYSLQKYEGGVSIGSFWLQGGDDEGDEDLKNSCISNIEEWAVHYQQIFRLEKNQDGECVFNNIFTDDLGVGGFPLYLLPKSTKDALIEKDKAEKKRLEESEPEWKKHLCEIVVDNDGQFVSRPLWKRRSIVGSVCGFQEFLGTFWLLKEKEDVLKNRINNVQTWGVSRIYILKSSDNGCVLKNIHTDKVYRCDSILLHVQKFAFLSENLKSFLLKEQQNSKELFVPLLSMSKPKQEVVLFYNGKCKNVRLMLHDIVFHKKRLGTISSMKVWFDHNDKSCWTASIGISYAEKTTQSRQEILVSFGQFTISPQMLKEEEDIQFLRRPCGSFKPPKTPYFYYYPTPGMKHGEYQPIPVRKGDQVNFRPKNYSGPSSSFRIVSVDNYGTDGIIVKSWDNRSEYFAKIENVTLEKKKSN